MRLNPKYQCPLRRACEICVLTVLSLLPQSTTRIEVRTRRTNSTSRIIVTVAEGMLHMSFLGLAAPDADSEARLRVKTAKEYHHSSLSADTSKNTYSLVT
jgi:hypothetical protein